MHRMKMVRLAHHLPRFAPRFFIKNADLASHHRFLQRLLLLGDQGLQFLQTGVGHVIGHGRLFRSRRTGAGGIFE